MNHNQGIRLRRYTQELAKVEMGGFATNRRKVLTASYPYYNNKRLLK
jgi:hypothetical protein